MKRQGTTVEREIHSQYLDETLIVKIYRPASFSSLYKYHICIMQDGDDYYKFGRIQTLSDRFHEDRSIENTVFAGIHYKDKFDRREKYHPEGARREAYMKFLAHEVVPLLDEEIPTYHMSGSRALMGDSLGGTISLLTALHYPHTFGKVIMQSPYVDEHVLQAVAQNDEIRRMDLYHSIGTEETAVDTTDGNVKDFITPNRELHEALQAKVEHYTYKEFEGNHIWKFWQQDLKDALPKIFGNS
ncbi:hypothetical protein N781_15585 [Pontibacillus halophilus JSM 076056 = DSM 19796]|uniref:Acetyl esterase n=1 Tax=Pontibacillus halophilus JSM 076056 = DSM 19796 TaxID=1385510 RepID=A0A0A5GNI0_9BACI|nr:alpha/beta hydrolase-fold protein [Pontibacillus halophilus]KGX92730.1 hypothetical protein N781_15585 [Pontibacillus halophilus JSM 076056 = DSM 19796]